MNTDSSAEKEIVERMDRYYTDYYRDALGIPDWEKHVASRRNEENSFAGRLIDWATQWTGFQFQDKEVLVVGGGTGAETFALHEKGARVTAVEPSEDAVKIVELKALHRYGISNPCQKGYGEALPFTDKQFDFVLCYTVLEHTQNPRLVLNEAIRVLRPGGWLFLVTPDYRGVYEQHYKLLLPLFLPRFILKIWLRMIERPAGFLDSLQFVKANLLKRWFQDQPVTAFQVFHSWPQSWKDSKNFSAKWMYSFSKWFGIEKDQYWLAQKLEEPR